MGSLEVSYDVKAGKVEGKEQRFFVCKVVFRGDEERLAEYTALLRSIRVLVQLSGGQTETLQGDASAYYSERSYPSIHKVESLMRRLITYFMLTHVGKDWVAENLTTHGQRGHRQEQEKTIL